MAEIDPRSRNAIFIKYGRLQAGAYGWSGIIAVVTIFLIAAKYFRVW
jgi:hypothetical protein